MILDKTGKVMGKEGNGEREPGKRHGWSAPKANQSQENQRDE